MATIYNLIVSDSGNEDHFFIHSGLSATITGSVASPANVPRGIVVDSSGNLISTDITTQFIYFHSGVSTNLTGSFLAPDNTYPWDLCFDGDNNLIIAAGKYILGSGVLFRVSGTSETVLGSLAFGSTLIPGVTWYNGSMIIAHDNNDKIQVYDGFSSNLIGSFAEPAPALLGLSMVGSNLVSASQINAYVYFHQGISATLTGSVTGTVIADAAQGTTIQILTEPEPEPAERGSILTLIAGGGKI